MPELSGKYYDHEGKESKKRTRKRKAELFIVDGLLDGFAMRGPHNPGSIVWEIGDEVVGTGQRRTGARISRLPDASAALERVEGEGSKEEEIEVSKTDAVDVTFQGKNETRNLTDIP